MFSKLFLRCPRVFSSLKPAPGSKKSYLLHSMMNTDNGTIRSMVSNQVSSRVQLTVIGNGANSNPISIAVSTDKLTHLFNCGEGVQRLVFEHKIKIGKIKNIFLTSSEHQNFAGLFGFLLTIAPYTSNFDLFCPSKMKYINQLYEQFLHHASNIDLKCIFVDQEQPSNEAKKLFEDQDFSIFSITIGNLLPSQKVSSVYFLLMKDKAGTLLINKCKELKIPPGPLFAKLKSGQEIEVNGKIIQPSDVLGPTEPGPAFIILECPTKEHAQELYQKGNLSNYLFGKHLEFIIHISPSEVVKADEYKNWLKEFPPSTKHVFLNQDNRNELSLISSSILQYKLNLIDDNMFKILNETQLPNFDLSNDVIINNCPTMFNYQLRPLKNKEIQFEKNMCSVDTDIIKDEILNECELSSILEEYRNYVISMQNSINQEHKNSFKSNILFLGTGSATPGKLRNTSAILVNFDQNKSMLLDCGEATFFQLNRYYGRENIDSILSSIQSIFISHIHADHHFGLIRILKERSRLKLEPLIVIAPKQIRTFLESYSSICEDIDLYYEFIQCNEMLYGKDVPKHVMNLKEKLLNSSSLDSIVTVPVPHCFDSHGIVVCHRDKKIAYSGDSMFSNAFDKAGRDCLLLIHEATMNDDLADEAQIKRHSTISEAIKVGRNINAQYTLLTHFSQRYAKIAPINFVEDKSLVNYIDQHVGIAFDFMNVALDELWKVTKIKPVLEKLFSDEIQEMQDTQSKRALKRKLIEEISI